MHFDYVTIAAELTGLYTALHLVASVVGPKLPKPGDVSSKWYPAIYAAVNWFALGNGPKKEG